MRTTCVVVVRGGSFDPEIKRKRRPAGEVLARVDDPLAIDELRDALQLADVQPDPPSTWMTPGHPTLALHTQAVYLGPVTRVSRDEVRSPWWPGDMVLREPQRLTEWLDRRAPGWELHIL